MPVHAAVGDEQLLRVGLRQQRGAAGLGLLGEEAAELRDRDDPVAVVAHRRRRRDPERGALRQQVDRLAVDLAVARHVLHRQAAPEEATERARVDDRAGEEVRAGPLPFSTTATGTSPSRSAVSGDSSSSWPSRIAQARPPGRRRR